jgi:hypothetical protein
MAGIYAEKPLQIAIWLYPKLKGVNKNVRAFYWQWSYKGGDSKVFSAYIPATLLSFRYSTVCAEGFSLTRKIRFVE